MKILLVGGSGFLGAWVARFLNINQCLARIFDPNKPDSEWHRLSGIRADATAWVAGDVSKKSELDDAIRDCQGVINLAGLLTPECSQNPVRGAEVNLIGAINVFEGALKHGLKKVAYTSSIGVYGPDHAEFPEPTTHYGSFKLASEGVARAFHEEHRISSLGVRPFMVYGPGREIGGSAGPSIACRMAAQGQAYQIPFTGLTGFVYAGDVAEILCQAMLEDFILEIQNQMPDANLSSEGSTLPVFGKIPTELSWSLSKNHEPTPLRTGIAKTLEYYKSGNVNPQNSDDML